MVYQRNSNDYDSGREFIFPGFSTWADHKAKPRKEGQLYGPTMVWDMLPYTKLLFMRDIGPSEVGGYAVTAKDDPLHVIDFFLLDQDSNGAFFKFSDIGVSDFSMDMSMGLKGYTNYTGDNYLAICCHTHPGNSASPSGTDMETFRSPSFSGRNWAVMFILSRGGEVSSRLRYNVGPLKDLPATPVIDLDSWTPSRDLVKMSELHTRWTEEYTTLVRVKGAINQHDRRGRNTDTHHSGGSESPGLYALKGNGISSALESRTGQYAEWDQNNGFEFPFDQVTAPLDNGVEADPISIDAVEEGAQTGEEAAVALEQVLADEPTSQFKKTGFRTETDEDGMARMIAEQHMDIRNPLEGVEAEPQDHADSTWDQTTQQWIPWTGRPELETVSAD